MWGKFSLPPSHTEAYKLVSLLSPMKSSPRFILSWSLSVFLLITSSDLLLLFFYSAALLQWTFGERWAGLCLYQGTGADADADVWHIDVVHHVFSWEWPQLDHKVALDNSRHAVLFGVLTFIIILVNEMTEGCFKLWFWGENNAVLV